MRRPCCTLLVLVVLPFLTAATTAPNPSDFDGDGLLNTEEDLNGDGIVNTGETDPYDADTDGGGEADGAEKQAGRNPLDRTDDYTYDLDGDGLTNGQEAFLGTNPTKADTDGDGINDKDDAFPLDGKYATDKDKDGLPDEYEAVQGLSNETRADAGEDADSDGLSNLNEFIQATDMQNPDTDGDGVADGEEVEKGDDPHENPCLFFAGPGEVLHDLENHWSKPFATLLQQVKSGEEGPRIIDGYLLPNDSREFMPDRQITRYELLKIALLSNCIAPAEPSSDGIAEFADLHRSPRPHASDEQKRRRFIVYTAADRNIIEGYPDGTFRPDEPVNRAEALKILFRASSLEPFDNESHAGLFSDVDDDAWYADSLHRALSYGFVEGYDDGTFRPGQSITRGEAAKIVLYMMISNPRINGYVVPTEGLDL